MPKEIHPYTVLLRPIVTEKTTGLAEQGKYVFEVDRRANKMQIREAVEIGFQVAVRKVNVMTVRRRAPRFRRAAGSTVVTTSKKAVVTLAPGYSIKLFEGV